MKRVIEIDEALYKRIANSDMNNACGTIRARDATVIKAIADSKPLNEVLDKIANEFEQNRLETIKLMNMPCQTKTMQEFKQQERYKADCDIICRTLQYAIDIINKYKESEDKNGK